MPACKKINKKLNEGPIVTLSLPSYSCIIIPLDCDSCFFLITIEPHRILSVSLGMNFNAAFLVSCINMWFQYVSPVWPLYFLCLPDFVLAVVSCYICCNSFPSPYSLPEMLHCSEVKFIYFVILSLHYWHSALFSPSNSGCSHSLNIVSKLTELFCFVLQN